MFDFLLRLFMPKHKQLAAKSKQVVDVFTKTVNDLRVINEQAQDEIDAKNAEIARIEAEKQVLIDTQGHNDKYIQKIENIFKD